ncbi:MAG TPA: zinc ribbon domain-containing protein [Gemmatimonadales bacterium]|nr:zinc ribbon domain-containing protein [Gemmatimonadales bacterium]
MAELVAGILLAAGVVYFVLRPILHPEFEGWGTKDGGEGDEGEDPDDDLSPQAVALRALKEIEFDRATGKLSDGDYDALKAKYTAEALTALRADTGSRASPAPAAQRAPAVAGLARQPERAPVCPTHGLRPESDAAFCSECGRRLAIAPGYCARCGTPLEREASYCHSCGARVAA